MLSVVTTIQQFEGNKEVNKAVFLMVFTYIFFLSNEFRVRVKVMVNVYKSILILYKFVSLGRNEVRFI